MINEIDPTLNRKNNEAYRDTIGLLRKARGLMVRLGREAEFAVYLEAVRAAHKPRVPPLNDLPAPVISATRRQDPTRSPEEACDDLHHEQGPHRVGPRAA